MAIQRRPEVLQRTKNSWSANYMDCDGLHEELEVKEIEALEEERFFEAFILQFSFLELNLDRIIAHLSKKLGLTETTHANLISEQSVNRKIDTFEMLVSAFVMPESKASLSAVVEKLREYNRFRNDLLHNCANPKKFDSAMHIDQAVDEAYLEGQAIVKALASIKLYARPS